MIEFCTLRAPREGMVAYATDSRPTWGRPNPAMIYEGATVRQGQPVVVLPNPKKMRVKARINETKISAIHPGMKATILVEAFPNKPLRGTVTEVTGIPASVNGFSNDVKQYNANVEIEQGGFEGLRAGLTARVSFEVTDHPNVTKIPIAALRWQRGTPFVAVSRPTGLGYEWRQVTLGLLGTLYAEVDAGLTVGERVVRDANALTVGPPERGEANETAVAAVLSE